ncbi:MAG: hypothetical protein Q8N56_01475 [bacterium]|nr:hypothetical protein [bacterium]
MKKNIFRLKAHFISIIIFLFLLPIYSEAIKIATWNLLNFPGTTGASREDDFRKVIDKLGLDILVVQEMTSYAGVDEFLNNVMNYSFPGTYEASPFFNGPDTDNALFYNKSKIKLYSHQQIPTTLRDISEYVLEITDGPGKGAIFRIYSVHLKAGSATSDKSQRTQEATTLRNHLNGLPPNSLFLVCGDHNLESSSEPAYGVLTGNQSDNDGRVKDPINRPGYWNDNVAFADIHTQSTRAIQFGGGASGGLDDRFDLILMSYALETSNELIFKTGSYFAYGNDGQHFNKAINDGINGAVSSEIATALYEASDHLPVIIEIDPPKIANHYLTISSNSGGTTNPPPGNYSYEEETKVVVTALPNKNYIFNGWTGDVPSAKRNDNPLELIMDSDKGIAANYLRIIYEPLNVSGQKLLNRSLSQAEYINVLTWNSNPNNENIVAYRVYIIEGSNKKFISEVNSTNFRIQMRKVDRNKVYTFSVLAVNNEDREGDPAYVTIR